MTDLLWPLKFFISTVQRDLSAGLAVYAVFAVAVYGTVDISRRIRQLISFGVRAHKGRMSNAVSMARIAEEHYTRPVEGEPEAAEPAAPDLQTAQTP